MASQDQQLQDWFDMLPLSYRHDGQFRQRATPNNSQGNLTDGETWYSSDLAAASLLYYHMARLLLLIHQPADVVFPRAQGPDLLQVLRQVEDKLRFHTSEVVAIFRGTLCDPVKLRAIQPLYVAGRCCKENGDKRTIVRSLQSVQDSLGVTTEYRVNELLQEWGLTYDDLAGA